MGTLFKAVTDSFERLCSDYKVACDKESANASSATLKSGNVRTALGFLGNEIQSLRLWDATELGDTSSVIAAISTLQEEIDRVTSILAREIKSDFIENLFIPGLTNIHEKIVPLKSELQRLDFAAAVRHKAASQPSQSQPGDSLQESFVSELHHFSTPLLKLGSLKTLHRELPDLSPLVKKIREKKGPLDGERIMPQDIIDAKSVLDALKLAWIRKWPDGNATKPLEIIQERVGVCLVLRAIGKLELLDNFAQTKCNDMSLPISRAELTSFLSTSDAAEFDITQYMAQPIRWEAGQHIKLGVEKPLPLRSILKFRPGGFGTVDIVQDVFTGVNYVRKRPHRGLRAEAQLKNEEKLLRKLGKHHHIVQYVKGYERGGEYGILLEPVGTGNLSNLLRGTTTWSHYREDHDFLMKAFGCLSTTLAYIHHHGVRHKDIKPENVLFIKEKISSPSDKFLWADFGNAYGFENESLSKTSGGEVFSKPYAAPEVFVLTASHGRSSDVFSLGCVFIDILCVFIDGASATSVFENEHSRIPYSRKISKIRTSIDGHIRDPGLESHILPLLELCLDMVKNSHRERLKIREVVGRLRNAGQSYFCKDCFLEAQSLPLQKASTSHKHWLKTAGQKGLKAITRFPFRGTT